jgi:hypothetical protein
MVQLLKSMHQEWGSGGQISGDQNRRLKVFMIRRSYFFPIFHEIESLNNALKVFLDCWSHEKFVSHKYDQEIQSCKSIICSFQSPEKFGTYKYNHEIKSI